jgi:hypothetical protein
MGILELPQGLPNPRLQEEPQRRQAIPQGKGPKPRGWTRHVLGHAGQKSFPVKLPHARPAIGLTSVAADQGNSMPVKCATAEGDIPQASQLRCRSTDT